MVGCDDELEMYLPSGGTGFTFRDQSERSIAPPDPRFIALHAALTRIFNVSGAGKCLNMLFDYFLDEEGLVHVYHNDWRFYPGSHCRCLLPYSIAKCSNLHSSVWLLANLLRSNATGQASALDIIDSHPVCLCRNRLTISCSILCLEHGESCASYGRHHWRRGSEKWLLLSWRTSPRRYS
ncbi:hypothetical protein OBBRIDRAFT_227488 [Obba rivulosa]|uniref:Uncharacterized protein n=1 Tax=Obba rivulosa TaxID=1052685 RepID=A0A8E2AKU9_9APHY|nr:hypothetical protein OBBRIDRAFT_227488 [Obba rivulosa]